MYNVAAYAYPQIGDARLSTVCGGGHHCRDDLTWSPRCCFQEVISANRNSINYANISLLQDGISWSWAVTTPLSVSQFADTDF